MNYIDFEKVSVYKNIYLIKGDAFLCDKVKKILANNLKVSNINISNFTDENFDVDEMLNSANQFSFFEEKRIVVVQDIKKELNSNQKTKINQYCQNYNNNCYLFFVDTILNGIFDFIKNIDIVECKPTEMYVLNYIKDSFKKSGIEISNENCKKLNNYCLGNLVRIGLEIKKISDYLISGEATSDIIDLLVFKDIELKVFDLTNALGNKNSSNAIIILNNMLSSGEAPIKILGLINGTFRRMLFAKINKGTNADLAKALNVKEFAVAKAKESASRFTASQLKNILNLLLEVDYSIKSGQMAQENALFYLICKIVNSN